MQDPNSRSLQSALLIHLSTEQNTAFINSYSKVQVVHSITQFAGEHLSSALVSSKCKKLVITWPSGCLADLPPSGASCYNYYLNTMIIIIIIIINYKTLHTFLF